MEERYKIEILTQVFLIKESVCSIPAPPNSRSRWRDPAFKHKYASCTHHTSTSFVPKAQIPKSTKCCALMIKLISNICLQPRYFQTASEILPLVYFGNDQFAGFILEQPVAWVERLSDAGLGLLLGIGSHWSHFLDFIQCRQR